MRSVSSSGPSRLPPPPSSGVLALRRPLPETSAPASAIPTISAIRPGSASNVGKSADSAIFSQDGQALVDQPEAQQKKVLSLLDQMFGISNVASMSLKIDVSHAHSLQTSSREQQQSGSGGISYDYQDASLESDYTALNATGTITLDDGRSFSLDLSYEHAVVVSSQRSLNFSSDAPSSDTTTPADLAGTGKRLLDQLFPPETMAKNLSDALRNLSRSAQLASSPHDSATAASTPASLIASLEVSAMSTHSINAVFSHLRDLRQQRQADAYQPTIDALSQMDVVS